MKRIICYYAGNGKDDTVRMLSADNANPILSLENGKWYFQGEKEKSEQVEILTKEAVFDKELSDRLCVLLTLAIKTTVKLAGHKDQETVGKENVAGATAAVVESLVSKASYEAPDSVFAFCASLFADLLMKHKLKNGNKRVATLLLVYCLRFFGYQLEWAHESTEEWTSSKTKIEYFVEKMENKDGRKTEVAAHGDAKEIADWIKTSSVVALEWRDASASSVAKDSTEELSIIVKHANESEKLTRLINVLAER